MRYMPPRRIADVGIAGPGGFDLQAARGVGNAGIGTAGHAPQTKGKSREGNSAVQSDGGHG